MKKVKLAVDFGTTNSVVAIWNEDLDGPEILSIKGICRDKTKSEELDDSYTIPSVVYLQKPSKVLSFPFNYLFKNFKSKTMGLIGLEAMEKNGGAFSSKFVDKFKYHLGKNSYQFIAKLDKWNYTAEDVSRIFFKALFSTIRQFLKLKISSVTFCVPVDFYEFYRAKLIRMASGLKTGKIRTIDEPVAAAIGYGLNVIDSGNILVIDFGGGTLDFALIKFDDDTVEKGRCHVIAKEGVSVGGNLVDSWIVEKICNHYSYDFDKVSTDSDIQWWYRMLLNEACRIKEELFFSDKETFYLMPSKIMTKHFKGDVKKKNLLKKPMTISKKELIDILQEKGLYEILDNLINTIVEDAELKGISIKDINDVLMVGGSTLLPNIYSIVEERFGRDRVRAWQPFNAVAFGAAAFAAERFNKTDYITHDYALITYNKKNLKQEYTVVIPRGTIFPTKKNFWKRQLSPTCALGEPETVFKLIVCEIGKKYSYEQDFLWDEKGKLHSLKGDNKDSEIIIPLNESDPTLGYLNPPHYPSEKNARVEISFMVNEDRWLCGSVYDLKTGKLLMDEKPVIRLK